MMNLTQKKRYRTFLAWIGFVVIYLALPVLIILAVHAVSQLGVTHYDRDTFLSIAHQRP